MDFEPPPLMLPRPWTEDVIYMILVDRFHRGAAAGPAPQAPFHGGNLAGVMEKLDYLCDLGVTALWLSPIYQNQKDGYHGYWPTDFKAVDPRFGTLDELKALVKECHRRGLKVLLDLVLNHAGYDHPMAKDPQHRHWFHRNKSIKWMDQRSLETGSLHGLPDFAHEHPEVASYLIDHALWWLEETGVDGFRLDAVKHVPSAFWKKISAAIHAKAGADFLLLGEVFRGVPSYLARYQREDGIDSVFDVPFSDTVRSCLTRDSEAKGEGLLTRLMELRQEYRTMLMNEILRKLSDHGRSDLRQLSAIAGADGAYVRPDLLATIIDNHDLSRFAAETSAPKQRLRMALTLLMTWRGIPVLTYGTEAGLAGKTSDGTNRAPMPFGSNPELHDHLRRLIRMRRSLSPLTKGRQVEVHCHRTLYAFLREAGPERVLTVINNSREDRRHDITIPSWIGWDGAWEDVLSGKRRRAREGRLEIELPERSVSVLLTVRG